MSGLFLASCDLLGSFLAPKQSRTSFAAAADDDFYYFYKDKNRSDRLTRVPIFAEIDNMGFAPGKLQASMKAQGFPPKSLGACFHRPLARRKPAWAEDFIYPHFRTRLMKDKVRHSTHKGLRYLTPSEEIIDKRAHPEDSERAIGVQWNEGSEEDPEWIFCLMKKEYWDGVKTEEIVKRENAGLWML